jgi:hypothetical protein
MEKYRVVGKLDFRADIRIDDVIEAEDGKEAVRIAKDLAMKEPVNELELFDEDFHAYPEGSKTHNLVLSSEIQQIKYYTTKEAAEYLCCSIKSVRRWDKSGALRAKRHALNNRMYYTKEMLDQYAKIRGWDFEDISEEDDKEDND